MGKLGGRLDEANADAIASIAAKLYDGGPARDLWQEKSPHELLDMLGVPRAGVLAPYSFPERLRSFRRQASYRDVTKRAHQLLSALDVPGGLGAGDEQPLRWRLERFLASAEGGGPQDRVDKDELVKQDGPEHPGVVEDEVQHPQFGDQEVREVPVERAAVPLVEPFQTREQFVRLQASELRSAGPQRVELVPIRETVRRLHAELVALRDLVGSLAEGFRERLEGIAAEVSVALPRSGSVPLVAEGAEAPSSTFGEQVADTTDGRLRRHVLLVILVVVLGLALAGVVVLVALYGREQVSSQVPGRS